LFRSSGGHYSPVYKIGSFEMEEMRDSRNDAFSPDFAGSDAESWAPGSVSSWNLPLVEQEEKTLEPKENFKIRLARLEKEAYEKGFEQGQRDGLALEQRKLEEVRRQIEEMFVSLRDLKSKIYSESEGEILKLSMLIARKIIGEEIKTNSRIIGNTIKSAMKFLTDKRKVRIILNPDDAEEVRKILPDISIVTKGGYFQLSEDKGVSRGGCILETGFGKINACIEDQLSVLEVEIEKLYRSFTG
jgi:flagellar biosynthesis/type III secretory pathway protein FliH